jgi:hypothetical protein
MKQGPGRNILSWGYVNPEAFPQINVPKPHIPCENRKLNDHSAFGNVLSWGNVKQAEFPNNKVPKCDQAHNCNGDGPGIYGRKCGWGKCGPGPRVPTLRDGCMQH